MISVKNSYEIAYNGTENECRFELYADTTADLQGLTHIDGIKIQMGSECTDIATGDKYILNGSDAWILQPSANAFANVYTKSDIDTMIYDVTEIIAYYHTTIVSDTGEITFYSLSGYIGTWKIYGNGQQTGTPSPGAPIMPEFVGVRTAQLIPFPYKSTSGTITGVTVEVSTNGRIKATGTTTSGYNWYLQNGSMSLPAGTYTVSFVGKISGVNLRLRDVESAVQVAIVGGEVKSQTFTLSEDCSALRIYLNAGQTGVDVDCDFVAMLNLGSTALPYEPYGYKIPLTCAGQTNNVYMSAPLRKAIDGTNAVDTLQSTGTLTRNVDENGDALVTPTTETIDVPAIPTVKGENTLAVDTELPPSLIEISGGITHE